MHFWATNGLRRPAWAIDVKEELLFENPYVVVARARHPLTRLKRITPRDLARCDWIMPEAGAPRRQAFARMFGGLAGLPSVSIDDIALDLPQHPGHIRPADPDVAARRPVERERGPHRPAVPLAASAPLRRRRQPDRLAPDQRPPAIPPAAAHRGAQARRRRKFFYASRVGTRGDRADQARWRRSSLARPCTHKFPMSALSPIVTGKRTSLDVGSGPDSDIDNHQSSRLHFCKSSLELRDQGR